MPCGPDDPICQYMRKQKQVAYAWIQTQSMRALSSRKVAFDFFLSIMFNNQVKLALVLTFVQQCSLLYTYYPQLSQELSSISALVIGVKETWVNGMCSKFSVWNVDLWTVCRLTNGISFSYKTLRTGWNLESAVLGDIDSIKICTNTVGLWTVCLLKNGISFSYKL